MVKRKCLVCKRTWYSSAAEIDWTCKECGHNIPKELNKKVPHAKEEHGAGGEIHIDYIMRG